MTLSIIALIIATAALVIAMISIKKSRYVEPYYVTEDMIKEHITKCYANISKTEVINIEIKTKDPITDDQIKINRGTNELKKSNLN